MEEEGVGTSTSSESALSLFKLVATQSVETSFLRGLRYANVSLTHSGVDTVRTRASGLARRHVGIVTVQPEACFVPAL